MKRILLGVVISIMATSFSFAQMVKYSQAELDSFTNLAIKSYVDGHKAIYEYMAHTTKDNVVEQYERLSAIMICTWDIDNMVMVNPITGSRCSFKEYCFLMAEMSKNVKVKLTSPTKSTYNLGEGKYIVVRVNVKRGKVSYDACIYYKFEENVINNETLK